MHESTHQCTICIQCFVIFLNVVALIVSFAMINCGAILLWNAPLVRSIAGPRLASIASGPVALTGQQIQDIGTDFHTLIAPIGWAPFIFGFVIFAAAILAIVGICCKNPDVLVAYAILTGLLIVIPIIIIIIYVSNRPLMMSHAYWYLEDRMMSYESVASGTSSSLIMGTIMAGYACCGVENGSDFQKPGWKFTKNDVIQGQTFDQLEYPLPCCKSQGATATTTTTTTSTTVAPPPVTTFDTNVCPSTFTPENSNIAVGCNKVINDQLVVITDIVAFTSVVPILFNVLLFALTVVLIVNYKQSFLI